jgi:hypothetical protein
VTHFERIEIELAQATIDDRRLRNAVDNARLLARVADLERKLEAARLIAVAFEAEISACPNTHHHETYTFGERDNKGRLIEP